MYTLNKNLLPDFTINMKNDIIIVYNIINYYKV